MSDHEVSMAKGQVRNSITNLKRVEKVLKTMTDKDDLPAWLQAKITDTEHNTDAAAGYMDEEVITEKRDGKSSKDKGYSLRTGSKVVVGNRLVVNMMVSPVRNNQVKRPNHIVVMQTTVLL